MTFRFDAEKALKRPVANANPAKAANTAPTQTPISRISSPSKANPDAPRGWGYTQDDLTKMDRLLRELAEIEGWTPAELEEMLGRRRRMAPARVPELLRTLQASRDAQLAGWPAQPKTRARFALTTLTVIEGGRSDSDPARSSKTPDREPEAA